MIFDKEMDPLCNSLDYPSKGLRFKKKPSERTLPIRGGPIARSFFREARTSGPVEIDTVLVLGFVFRTSACTAT